MKTNELGNTIGRWMILAVLLLGCIPEQLEEEALRTYVLDKDHGLLQQKEVNELLASVYHKPTGLMLAQELRNKESKSDSLITAIKQKYEDYAYFVLELSYKGHEVLRPVKGTPAYADLLNKLAFRMGEYATLKTDKGDEIPVADFYFPRTYGASKATRLLFVFHKEKLRDTQTFKFKLEEFGLGVGKLTFEFATNDLETTPKLKI